MSEQFKARFDERRRPEDRGRDTRVEMEIILDALEDLTEAVKRIEAKLT